MTAPRDGEPLGDVSVKNRSQGRNYWLSIKGISIYLRQPSISSLAYPYYPEPRAGNR